MAKSRRWKLKIYDRFSYLIHLIKMPENATQTDSYTIAATALSQRNHSVFVTTNYEKRKKHYKVRQLLQMTVITVTYHFALTMKRVQRVFFTWKVRYTAQVMLETDQFICQQLKKLAAWLKK